MFYYIRNLVSFYDEIREPSIFNFNDIVVLHYFLVIKLKDIYCVWILNKLDSVIAQKITSD